MKHPWFKRLGWLYCPASWQGFALSLLAMAFCAQVFIAIDVAKPAGAHAVSALVSAAIDDLHLAVAAPDGSPARYPGESVLRIREDNRRHGVPVDEQIWEEIKTIGE